MKLRYIAAELFFVSAVLYAFVGTIVFERGEIGRGLDGYDYLNPLFWITIPRLIPFAAAILSAFFGLAYFGIEKRFRRPVNLPLATVQLILFLLATIGHEALVRFWWHVLDQEVGSQTSLPSWPGFLLLVSSGLCCLVFAINVFLTLRSKPLEARAA
ncbi:MAG: hypothetical protein WA581_08370 [Candidatus Acidiferrales bacterium]